MRETRQSGSEGGEGDLPDPYTRDVSARLIEALTSPQSLVAHPGD
jgi:hypothetical protein